MQAVEEVNGPADLTNAFEGEAFSIDNIVIQDFDDQGNVVLDSETLRNLKEELASVIASTCNEEVLNALKETEVVKTSLSDSKQQVTTASATPPEALPKQSNLQVGPRLSPNKVNSLSSQTDFSEEPNQRRLHRQTCHAQEEPHHMCSNALQAVFPSPGTGHPVLGQAPSHPVQSESVVLPTGTGQVLREGDGHGLVRGCPSNNSGAEREGRRRVDAHAHQV